MGDAYSFSRDEVAYSYNDLSKLYLTYTQTHTGRWEFQTTLDWAGTYGKHDISAMAGFEAYYLNDQSFASTKTGFENNVLEEMDNVLEATSISGSQTDYAAASVFGRVTYSMRTNIWPRSISVMTVRRVLPANPGGDSSPRSRPDGASRRRIS